ncbi:MAG: hypothetical protein UT93_C0024G0004 [Candidatus Woesebacteria bacterium GW2011_GWF1_40_24]|uniref:Uncharacterized protein n=4 Tax=Candidatus Woeseibacteriota TaxID=1752722 RepID=A0A0G0RZC5_9BACT|nr:MAG: hypothetical protein UT76_C0022G0006 [Candidatus Woesebacteria bacterium GW2011_GWB1_40_12]KKR55336.1 MAG: hypothetical protein UT93_C0024G0004 [Candidatus Woesebacteria bacterium GW2011_GWF1_40_24]KKR90420.1 MAG: hypothetical protein UU39_C0013G0012 [Candidatus Woesebacteria bacterium GW2011_GWD1_41_12]OGM81193.1 MAG: hypothetical protein A2393_01505 [Candidatus Woesebacteria bacterium RIFOXYB1_FULL_41_13]
MTYIESPTKTIERFIPSWRHTQKDRLNQEIISAFNETHRHPDKYKFKFNNEKLVDYLTDTEINIDSSTYLGKKDAELLNVLTSWVSENESGTAIWISPAYESAYPCNKITMYKIEADSPNEKTTSNITVLFDSPKNHTLQIAAKLNPSFDDIKDPETLRNKLFVVDGDFNLAGLLELVGEKNSEIPTPSSQLVDYFVGLIQSGMDAEFVAQQMDQKGIVGSFSVSCGGLESSSSLEKNSLTINLTGQEDRYGSLSFTCPKCGTTNIRPFGRLLQNCMHCGGDVRC